MDTQFYGSSGFGPVFNFSHGQGPAMHYPEGQYPVFTGFHGLQYVYAAQQAPNEYPPDRNSLSDGKTESKPRLSKDEVERLEKIFLENPKPSSSVKAQLADELGLERPRINNWFQNRRAKAKQERKQEEYEARRAAEKSGSEPRSPTDLPCSATELFDQDTHQRMKPSSAPFPELNSAAQPATSLDSNTDCEEDVECDAEDFESPYAPQSIETHLESASGALNSPLSLHFCQSEETGFSYSHASQTFSAPGSMQSYASFGLQERHSVRQLDQEQGMDNTAHGLPSPEERLANPSYQADHYLKLVGTGYPSSALPFYHQRPIMEEESKQEYVKEEDESISSCHVGQATTSPQGIPIPVNSFKSPPPPANIASRRNISRPAALTVATSRSRSYNLGPKTGMDGMRRADPTSPATAMRRIASAGGNMAGRIHKQCAGPRSPLFLNRNTEAFLQFHSRSPVGVFSAAFSGATPPTPMTPAVMTRGGREPTVSSTCSDDDAFMLGHGIESLKTPPETPGVLGSISNNFNGNPYNTTGLDFTADQPLLTPYFQTEFPDLAHRPVPGYVEMSDSSLPSTPLYPNMMGSTAQDPNSLMAAQGNTQYDWDTNESITSTKSSPGQPRSRQIQFTPNITPQDYTVVQDR
ncbi:homeobox domain-containing protein [Seiridium cupressi]